MIPVGASIKRYELIPWKNKWKLREQRQQERATFNKFALQVVREQLERRKDQVKDLVSCLVSPQHPLPLLFPSQDGTWAGRETEIQEGERITARSVFSRGRRE